MTGAPPWFDGGVVAVAHDVRSMHNVGAIFRTADGAGFAGVILSGISGGPTDPRVAKVALGAEQALPHLRVGDVSELIGVLSGAYVVLVEQSERSVSVSELIVPPDGPVAVVVCGELDGAPEMLVKRADIVAEIPMRGSKESLNVSVAFGIAAYRVSAQRWPDDDGLLRHRGRRPVRDGVLTRGVSQGPAPHRDHQRRAPNGHPDAGSRE